LVDGRSGGSVLTIVTSAVGTTGVSIIGVGVRGMRVGRRVAVGVAVNVAVAVGVKVGVAV
jgi:hypothetical protein